MDKLKVVVSHDGKQHVNHLLIALARNGWLARFYTPIVSNVLLRIVPAGRWQRALKKRAFWHVDTRLMRQFLLPFILEKVARNQAQKIRYAYGLFDAWVAQALRRETAAQMVIGYENSNRRTFTAARQLGKITVLDLAYVHHAYANEVKQRFGEVSADTYGDDRKTRALAQTQYILTLSSLATNSLIRAGFDGERIYDASLGVDTQLFRPSEADREPGGSFQLLYVGALHRMKGLATLLAAFQQLALPDATLTLVGPVGDAPDLLADCTGPVRHVPFLHHNELVTYYQQADVFVFPSYLDSWGQVVLEAMACGTPVIITENTGAKDAVARGGGVVIPAGDVTALSEKIRYFYQHRHEVTRLGAEARRVAEQYTWEHYYQRVADALTDIAGREGLIPPSAPNSTQR